MTEDVIAFHLRDVCGTWTAPKITATTLHELEIRNLIEQSAAGIRLTRDGERAKRAFARRTSSSKLPLSNPVRDRVWKKRGRPGR